MNYLNLYAALGGNRKLLPDNVHVTAVEMNPKIAAVYARLYPQDELIIGDAHKYLIDHHKEFDFVWSSPPCQSHSKMNKFTRHNMEGYVDGKLVEEIIFLEHWYKGNYVVENVVPYYKPYGNPVKIGRHLFWSNYEIKSFDAPKSPKNFINEATVSGKKMMMDWLDIHYEENIYYGNNHCPAQILRNCVHPKIGLEIYNQSIFNP